MADILASVSVVLGAEVSQFKAAMADARRELKGLQQAGEAMKNLGTTLSQYVSLPLAGIGAASLASSAKLESLRKGLEAVAQQELGKAGLTGLSSMAVAAQQTGERLTELLQIAKAPGLSFEGAEAADIRLRAVGISAEQSAKSIKAFANAIATTGGGGDEFNRVTVQLAQLSAKGKVLAQDLRPILEAAPAVAAALQRLYGTVDSETISASLAKQGKSSTDFIAVLTDELAKLPQVTGGLKAIYENDMDALLVASAKVGDGIAKAFNLQAVGEQLGNQITAIGDSFADLSAPAQAVIVTLGGLAAATGPVLLGLGTLGLALPNIKAGFVAVESGVQLLSTGFAALLNPTTLAIAGIAALAGGAYYLATASERAHQSFLQQAAATRQLTTEISPLLDRYDQLKSKTSLSAQEQEELRAIIEKVAQLMPEAGSKIDGYGKVIDIAADKARKFIASNQGITKALALDDLPKQQAKLEKLEQQYANLTRQSEEFNKTGRVTISPGDKTSYGFDELGKTFFADLQTNLNQTSAALAAQRKELEQTQQSAGVYAGTLHGQLTPALSEAELALKFLGGQGQDTTGLLAGLHEQLKGLRQEQQDAPTAQLALAYVPLIKNLQDYIARLEGSDKATKKTNDAVAKLHLELSRLTALDNLLGDTPSQLQVLERRADTLVKGLKTLVDAGVSPASKAFQDFERDMVRTSQAADRIMAGIGKDKPDGEQLDLKPVEVKSLIPQTIGDTLAPDVARLLGDYAKQLKPFELPVQVKLNMQALSESMQPIKLGGFEVSKDLKAQLDNIGEGYRQATAAAQVFGTSFDEGQAKANTLRAALENLIASGVGPSSEALKELGENYRKVSDLANINTAATQSLKSGLTQLGVGLLEGLGQLATGAATLSSFGDTVLKLVGNLATQLGEAIIAVGVGMLELETAFTNPISAIAAGAVLVGVGAALGSISSGLSSVGSGGASGGIGSTPTISNYGQNSKAVIKVEFGELRLRGQDLVAVRQQHEYRSGVTG